MYTSEVVLIGFYKAGAGTGWRSFSPLHPIPPSRMTETHQGSAPSQIQTTNGSELYKWELSLQFLSQRWNIGLISPVFQQCPSYVKLCVPSSSLREWAAEKSDFSKVFSRPSRVPW